MIIKEDLWNKKDINKWDITNFDNIDRFQLLKDKEYAFSKMCTSETKRVNELHNKLNFCNYTNKEQYDMVVKIDQKRFINNIKLFAKEFYISLNDSLNIYSELGSFVE